jgi:hypothetical protein
MNRHIQRNSLPLMRLKLQHMVVNSERSGDISVAVPSNRRIPELFHPVVQDTVPGVERGVRERVICERAVVGHTDWRACRACNVPFPERKSAMVPQIRGGSITVHLQWDHRPILE